MAPPHKTLENAYKDLPNFQSEVRSKHVGGGYRRLFIKHNRTILVLFAMALISYSQGISLPFRSYVDIICRIQQNYDFIISICAVAAILIALFYYFSQTPTVYLVDFAVYEGEEYMRLTHEKFDFITRKLSKNTASYEFQKRIAANSTLGESTLFPPVIMKSFPDNICEQNSNSAAIEAQTVLFDCVARVLKKAKMHPRKIDILVVNCSLYCPTPSLAAMIVRKFQMKETVHSYNLGGMGCSAGVIALDLASDLLKLPSNSFALVVSTENITQNWYYGEDRSMLIPNTLFRVGGSAVLLANHRRKKVKMRLLHTVKTHKGSDEKCFSSVVQKQDSEGKMGVSLSKNVMEVAGKALKTNITVLAPLILPWSEQLKYILHMGARTIILKKLSKSVPEWLKGKMYNAGEWLLVESEENSLLKKKLVKYTRWACHLEKRENGELKPFVPDFTKAVDHFCIHAGGKRVIDAIEMNINLPKEKVEASRQILRKMGNTSSSSIWYEMDYHLKHSKLRKKDRIWQIAFGSGFKCNSAVWQVL